MPSLAELQSRFAEALADGREGDDPGFDVYRHSIRANRRTALGATFPVVAALVGEPFFHAAVDAFARVDPPRSGDLNEYGAGFADFLGGYAPARALAYLADVARLEWAIDEASRAADVACDREALVAALQADAAGARVALHPSCRMLACEYPAFAVWRYHQQRGDERQVPNVDAAPERLLVRREAGRVGVARIGEAQCAWLAALASGASLEEAVDAALAVDRAFDLAAALAARVADGTLARIVRD